MTVNSETAAPVDLLKVIHEQNIQDIYCDE